MSTDAKICVAVGVAILMGVLGWHVPQLLPQWAIAAFMALAFFGRALADLLNWLEGKCGFWRAFLWFPPRSEP